MKLIGIGDLYVTTQMIAEGLSSLKNLGIEVQSINWPLSGYDELQAYNLKIETAGPDAVTLPDEIITSTRDAEVLVTHFCPINHRMISQCPRLKIIGVLRGGVKNIAVKEATNRGITILNTPGHNAHAVSDFTVGLIIAEARNIGRAHAALKCGKWRKDFYNWSNMPELYNRTVGIIGYGCIGSLVARKLSGFEMKIMGYDPYIGSAQGDNPFNVEFCDLKSLLSKSDFVTIHAKLTKETNGLIGREELRLMKPTSYLINTARAEIVEEDALREALEQHWLSGAALDVFYREPPMPDDWILTLDNVTLTPHMAGTTYDAYTNSVKIMCRELQRYIGDSDSKNMLLCEA